jgi:hypothetical protein
MEYLLDGTEYRSNNQSQEWRLCMLKGQAGLADSVTDLHRA